MGGIGPKLGGAAPSWEGCSPKLGGICPKLGGAAPSWEGWELGWDETETCLVAEKKDIFKSGVESVVGMRPSKGPLKALLNTSDLNKAIKRKKKASTRVMNKCPI